MSVSVCHVSDTAGLDFKSCLQRVGLFRAKKVELIDFKLFDTVVSQPIWAFWEAIYSLKIYVEPFTLTQEYFNIFIHINNNINQVTDNSYNQTRMAEDCNKDHRYLKIFNSFFSSWAYLQTTFPRPFVKVWFVLINT